MPWGSCPCPGVEMRGSCPPCPTTLCCVQTFTLPYLTTSRGTMKILIDSSDPPIIADRAERRRETDEERRRTPQGRAKSPTSRTPLLRPGSQEREVSPDTGRRERASRHAAFIGANITRTGKTSRTSEHATSSAARRRVRASLSF